MILVPLGVVCPEVNMASSISPWFADTSWISVRYCEPSPGRHQAELVSRSVECSPWEKAKRAAVEEVEVVGKLYSLHWVSFSVQCLK